jgi:hypothetical protein
MGAIVADLLVGGVPAVRPPQGFDHNNKSTKTAPRRRTARAVATSTEGDNA